MPLVNTPVRSSDGSRTSRNTRMLVSSLCTTSPCAACRISCSNAGLTMAAVFSAKAGFSGDLRLFEGEFFPGVYNLSPDEAVLVDALEERSVLAEVSFKPWCAAKQTMAATQALREIIEEGVNGFIVDALGADELARRLDLMNGAAAQEMGRRARQRAMDFSVDKMAGQFLALYRSLAPV